MTEIISWRWFCDTFNQGIVNELLLGIHSIGWKAYFYDSHVLAITRERLAPSTQTYYHLACQNPLGELVTTVHVPCNWLAMSYSSLWLYCAMQLHRPCDALKKLDPTSSILTLFKIFVLITMDSFKNSPPA